jgi:hypothetical protein
VNILKVNILKVNILKVNILKVNILKVNILKVNILKVYRIITPPRILQQQEFETKALLSLKDSGGCDYSVDFQYVYLQYVYLQYVYLQYVYLQYVYLQYVYLQYVHNRAKMPPSALDRLPDWKILDRVVLVSGRFWIE